MANGEPTQNTGTQAQKVRELFLAKHKDDLEQGLYDDRDATKFRDDDVFVASFIRSYETLQVAADRIHDCLKFRLEFGVNDLTVDSFPLEIWESGGAYYHNHDKDGLKILYLQVKLHKKDPQVVPVIKKFFAYLLETQLKQHPNDQIVLLFDLYGAGLSHLDMDFIKYIITSFKVYFPQMLGYMLMYEMPWLFNAAWKIIKTWLPPEAVSRIKFVTKSDIQTYINKDQLWEHMGGTDKYVFKYDPAAGATGDGEDSPATRKRCKPVLPTTATYMEVGCEGIGRMEVEYRDCELEPADVMFHGIYGLKVTFADPDKREIYKSFSNDSIKDQGDGVSPTRHQNSILQHSRPRGPAPAPGKRRQSQDDNSFIGRLLTVCPAEELEFIMEEGSKEASDVIILKNTLPYPISYKVKTTSPEKYRVRPSSGTAKAGSQVEVLIHLHDGYANTVHKDKFLVMAMEVANESPESNAAELWKSVQRENIMEHRLRCIVTSISDTDSKVAPDNKVVTMATLSEKVDALMESNRQVQRTVRILLVLQAFFLLGLFIVICIGYFYWGPSMEAEGAWQAYCNGNT